MLLRHAKAEPAGAIVDELRPLTLAGRRQCAAVGASLADAGLLPELVLVSTAVRTRQTWELVRAALGDAPEPDVEITDRVYEARAADVVDLLRGVDERVTTVCVVGHEPTMSGATALLGGASAGEVRTGLPTATFAVLEVRSWADLEPGTATLVDVVRPNH